jgi:hypothetical protein
MPSRRRPDEDGAQKEPPPPRRAIPPAGLLRRERRAILRAREEGIRDLGGLLLEMYRRDLFREDLLREHCAELLSLEARLQEIDLMLGGRHPGYAGRCECGAPLLWGSHFCANCGRPAVGDAVVACPRCGHALPGDARFCAACGSPAPAGETPSPGEAVASDNGTDPAEPPVAAEPPVDAEPPADPKPVVDPWET